MPNRIIKESIRTSDSINQLKPIEEILFYRLIVSCDDYGRFDGRPAIIKGSCFPLKDITVKDIEKALFNLSTVGMIILYEVEGKPYLQLTNWEQHQTIRAKRSKYPEPNESNIKAIDSKLQTYENNCMQLQADVPVIQSNPNPNLNPKKNMYIAEACTLFEKLWDLYPSKKGKAQIGDTAKIRLLNIGEEQMIRCIDRYKSELQKDSDWRKPQNGSTFFNSGYVDYLDENFTPSKPQNKKSTNKFNNFEQREYDYDSLERQMLMSQGG